MVRQLARDIAVDVFSQPLLARQIQRNPLPDGMLEVIQIAAGHIQSDKKHLTQEAAVFFLQQVLVSRDNDNFRQLGLNPGASLELVREHRRWLLKWLHPDRNHNKWESTLFARVNSAAARLENPVAPVLTQRNYGERKTRNHRPLKTLKVKRLVPRWKIILHLVKRGIAIAMVGLFVYFGITRLAMNQQSYILTDLTKDRGN
jgi:hypothetical protein